MYAFKNSLAFLLNFLAFLDDPETYMPHEPSKPKEDYSKQIFRVVEPGKGKGFQFQAQKIEEPKPAVGIIFLLLFLGVLFCFVTILFVNFSSRDEIECYSSATSQ